MKYNLLSFFSFFLFVINSITAQVITTVIGTGTIGNSGDGGPALNAQIFAPYGICFDNANNLYFADRGSDVIRKVDVNGIITTIAGTGVSGYSGDNGPATSATLFHPEGICIDASGNIYFSDNGNQRIRKISTTGIITLVAGTGVPGYAGDGGPAINAAINSPEGIAMDNSGNIYFSSWVNHVVRKIDNTGTITTFAGTGWAGNSGNGGPASLASLNLPYGIHIDAVGNIYISEYGNHGVRKINTAGIISGFAGSGPGGYSGDGGPATSAQFWSPKGMCSDQFGNLYIADDQSHLVRKVNSAGIISTFAGDGALTCDHTGDGGPANLARLCFPVNIQTDVAGNIYISDRGNNVIRKVAACIMPAVTSQPINKAVCASTNVSFSVTATNTTSYHWQVNTGSGWTDLSDNASYAGSLSATLNLTAVSSGMNNYQYRCVLINSCGNIISSAGILTVTNVSVPSITISTASNTVCEGKAVLFNTSVNNPGNTISYQWKKNGLTVGSDGGTCTVSNLANGDIITCTITVTGDCFIPPVTTSNSLMMTVIENPVVQLNYTASLCKGSSQLLDAGTHPSYSWNDGSTGSTLLVTTTGTYFVTITGANGCTGSDTAKILTLITPPSNFLPDDTSICSYGTHTLIAKAGYQSYAWNTTAPASSISITLPGIYWLDVTDFYNCKGRDSIRIGLKECRKGFYIPTGFTPDNNGRNDFFKPLLFGDVINYKFSVYNRWGQVIFQSNDISKAWDGRINGLQQDSGIFAWTCMYQLAGESIQYEKGTVMLIR